MTENGNQTTALTKVEQPSVPMKLTEEDIRKYICAGQKYGEHITDAEVFMFRQHCLRHDLDPYIRDAHLVKYKKDEPASIITAYRIFIERASGFPDYNGFQAGVIVQKGNEIIRREGTLVLKGETLLGGWCKVYRKGRDHPTVVEVMMEEYLQTRWDYDAKKRVPQAKWKTSPATMIRKTAVGQCHHDAYPTPFKNMYTDAELPTGGMDLSEEPIPVEAEVIDSPETTVVPPEQTEVLPPEGEPEPEDNGGPKCGQCENPLTAEDIANLDAEGIADNTCLNCLETKNEAQAQEPQITPEKVKRLHALAGLLKKLTQEQEGPEYAKSIGVAAKVKVGATAKTPLTQLTRDQGDKVEIILEEHIQDAKEQAAGN